MGRIRPATGDCRGGPGLFEATAGVVDADDYLERSGQVCVYGRSCEGGAWRGSRRTISSGLAHGLGGDEIGLVHLPKEKNPVQMSCGSAGGTDRMEHFGEISVRLPTGKWCPCRNSFGSNRLREKAIYHKNQKPVVYVIGDVGGPVTEAESPVYGVMGIGKKLELVVRRKAMCWSSSTRGTLVRERFAMKWDGEWHITYETFRDMGIAFSVALLLIYLLIVGEFQSFLTPVVIMAPIPLTLSALFRGIGSPAPILRPRR